MKKISLLFLSLFAVIGTMEAACRGTGYIQCWGPRGMLNGPGMGTWGDFTAGTAGWCKSQGNATSAQLVDANYNNVCFENI